MSQLDNTTTLGGIVAHHLRAPFLILATLCGLDDMPDRIRPRTVIPLEPHAAWLAFMDE